MRLNNKRKFLYEGFQNFSREEGERVWFGWKFDEIEDFWKMF